jgi:VWFA-related protein
VRAKDGEVVSNLTKDDFRVYEDGRVQQIALFSNKVTAPLTVGLLVDTSRSERNMLGTEQNAASHYIHDVLSARDEAMVISFDSEANLLADFTEDTSILDRAIRRVQIELPQRKARSILYDAIYLACHDRLREQAGRRVLLILSDAEDYGSEVTMQDAIEAAQRADTVIYFLRIADPQFSTGYGFGSRGEVIAEMIAQGTGGRAIEIRSQENMDKALGQISKELRSQYMIGYYPTNTKHDGTFRKIKVKMAEPYTKVLTRRGYYAPKS